MNNMISVAAKPDGRPLKRERDSNIELLRILATLGVLFLHFNTASDSYALLNASGTNRVILYLLETVSICGVDLLVLISGYFMVNQSQCSLWKPIELIIQSCLLGTVLPYLIEIITGKAVFDFGTLVWNAFNIVNGKLKVPTKNQVNLR